MAKNKHKIRKSKSLTTKNNTVYASILVGLVYGYVITAVCFIILALLLTYTNMMNNPSTQNIGIILITVIAVLIAGLKTARSYKDIGWLWGGITGLIYYVIFFIIAFFMNKDFTITSGAFSMLLLCLGSGALGGVLGYRKEEA